MNRSPVVLVLALVASVGAVQEQPQVFRGATIHPISGDPIAAGVLVVRGGRIVAIGPSAKVHSPSGATEHDLSGKVLIPGLVDSHSHIGSPAGGDSSDPLNPEVRSLDSIDIHSDGFWRARAGGITTVNVMPGSGHLMSGQTTYLKLRKSPRTIDDWLLCEDSIADICGSMKMANGTNSIREEPFPGTRSKSAALVRNLFVEAQAYLQKIDAAEAAGEPPPPRDLRLEGVVQILREERRVQHHTHRHNDIVTVMRLAEEFGFRPVIQHGTDAWKVADELAAAELPVSVTYLDSPGGKEEALGWNMRIGALLERAGVDVSFNTDDFILDSRLLLRYAALNVRYGMTEEGALEALTLAGARALGLDDDRIGSLEAGKDADFVVLSGVPFSVYTHVEQSWVEGQLIFDRSDPEDRKYAVGGFEVYRAATFDDHHLPGTEGGDR